MNEEEEKRPIDDMKKIARVGFGSIESNRKFWWV
jgi:hypothetical protein